jgi:tetratricopeptide (TPR) repeat protein
MKRLENIYHTDNATDAEFINRFTIRQQEFEQILNAIKEEGLKSFQNFLIVGKRGMGKSTLLRRLDIEVKQHWQQKIISVRLRSEGYRISRLFKLWEQVIEHLYITYPNIKQQQQQLATTKNYEENLFLLIHDVLTTQNKKLVLFIDNFDVLINNFNAKEQHQLREILIQYPIQIIANTLFYLEAFFSYKQPFYNFFKVVKLRNLTQKESLQFIDEILEEEAKLGNTVSTNKSLNTVNTLCILAGGVPRTIILLTSVLFDNNLETTMEHLKKMVELTTPLYQDRMNHLSAQQQEIMYNLAMIWDKTGVKEIAERMRSESKTVSAQLKVLEQNGYVVKETTDTKNHLYYIDERFFNIWFLMSEGMPYDGSRVLWLTKTLDILLNEEDITHYAKSCLGKLKTTEHKYFFVQALSQSNKLPNAYKLDLINAIQDDDKNCQFEESKFVAFKKEEILKGGSEDEIYSKESEKKYDDKNYEEALELLLKIKEKSGYIFFRIGCLYYINKDISNAIKYYLYGIEKGNANAAWNIALLYDNDLRDYISAEKYYLIAASSLNDKAMFNLAHLYQTEFNDFEKAERYYLMAIEYNSKEAINNLAIMYFIYNKKKEDSLKLINNENINTYFKSAILLWNEKNKDAINLLISEIQKNKNFLAKFVSNIDSALIAFLVFHQKNTLLNLFTEYPILKDVYKVLFYALLTEAKAVKELATMPPELAEPVNNLLKEIKQEREKYGV